jgi:hypothetical protein
MADEEFQQEVPEPRRRRAARPLREDEDDDIRIRRPDVVETFIPYKNPLALIAYYVGVFAVIPCAGLLLGPAALVLGIMGIRYRNKHPTAGGLGHAITGVVLGSLTTLANWGFILLMFVGAGMGLFK